MGASGNHSWQDFRTAGGAYTSRQERRAFYLRLLYSYLSTLAITLAVASIFGGIIFFLLICRPRVKTFDHEIRMLITAVMTLALLIGSGIRFQTAREEIRTRLALERREGRAVYHFRVRSRGRRG